MAAKTSGAVLAAGAGAAVVNVTPPDTSIWAIAVLGIPLGVLAAALGGSAVRHLREPAEPDFRLPVQAFATIADGFVGGWLAMALISIPFTAAYIGDVVRPEVIGALCALLTQFARDNAKGYWDQIWGVIVEAFRSWAIRRSGAPRPPSPGGDP